MQTDVNVKTERLGGRRIRSLTQEEKDNRIVYFGHV